MTAAALPDDRLVLLDAAVRRLGGLASHHDAASLWGIELVLAADALHVTVERGRSRVTHPGTVVHRATVPAAERAVLSGVPATTATRTVLDLARVLPLPEAVAAADSALRRRLLSPADLVAAVAALGPGRGRPACRELAARVDHRSGSVLESLGRVLFDDAGLRPFETQHPIVTAAGDMVRVDFAWLAAKVVVELDGFAFHADRASYRGDRRRTNALVLSGWRVLRFSWEDVVGRPEVVVAQVRAALAA